MILMASIGITLTTLSLLEKKGRLSLNHIIIYIAMFTLIGFKGYDLWQLMISTFHFN